MKILLVPDKFKGSATTTQVIDAMREGIHEVAPSAQVDAIRASDGGDGFLEALSEYVPGEKVWVDTVDPLGKPIRAFYWWNADSHTAYVELAAASGMHLLQNSLDACKASTYGTGLQMAHAIQLGATTVVLGLGGSASTDGGTGMASALGYVFKDGDGHVLPPNGATLSQIASFSHQGMPWKNVSFIAVNDVTNPLFGMDGAAHVYGPQKGASATEVALLDRGLRQLHQVVQKQWDKSLEAIPGAGAAGGSGYGLMAFLDAQFKNGTDFLFELSGLEDKLAHTPYNYILTGEGKIDEQTLQGKLINGVAALGKRYNIPVIGLCGALALGPDQIQGLGLAQAIAVGEEGRSLEYNMTHAPELIRKRVQRLFTALLNP